MSEIPGVKLQTDIIQSMKAIRKLITTWRKESGNALHQGLNY